MTEYMEIYDTSQVGAARRQAASACRAWGVGTPCLARVELAVTEAAKNLLKHAGGGTLLLHLARGQGKRELFLLSLDKGPGMDNPARFLQNGYSTAGTPGTGLGALRRLSDVFDIYSLPGRGTAILSVIHDDRGQKEVLHDAFTLGVVCVPLKGEEVCGDAWAVEFSRGRAMVLLVDGLGHGILAAEAARAAVSFFRENAAHSPSALLELLHEALHRTRGAAGAVAEIVVAGQTVRYAGVGNISAKLADLGTEHSLVSLNGTLGLELRKVREFTVAWPQKGLLVIHTDGLSGRWNLDDYPGLRARHPALIAGVLYRDYRRPQDDGAVLVLKEGSQPGA